MKSLRILAIALMGLVGFLAAPASAQTANQCPDSGAQYPPECEAPRVSPTSVRPGETVRFTGECPAPGRVDFRLSPGGASLGSAQTNADGNFDASLTIPSTLAPGTYTIEYRCTAVLGATFQRGASVQVLGAAPTRAGTLPRTGTGLTIPLAASAALLLGAGAVAVIATRRRRA